MSTTENVESPSNGFFEIVKSRLKDGILGTLILYAVLLNLPVIYILASGDVYSHGEAPAHSRWLFAQEQFNYWCYFRYWGPIVLTAFTLITVPYIRALVAWHAAKIGRWQNRKVKGEDTEGNLQLALNGRDALINTLQKALDSQESYEGKYLITRSPFKLPIGFLIFNNHGKFTACSWHKKGISVRDPLIGILRARFDFHDGFFFLFLKSGPIPAEEIQGAELSDDGEYVLCTDGVIRIRGTVESMQLTHVVGKLRNGVFHFELRENSEEM